MLCCSTSEVNNNRLKESEWFVKSMIQHCKAYVPATQANLFKLQQMYIMYVYYV